MKINKYNPFHLITVFVYLINLICAGLLAMCFKSKKEVFLYGHRLNGNLLSVYNNYDSSYITINYLYYRRLKKNKKNIYYALNIFHFFKFLNSSVLICSESLIFIKLFKIFSKSTLINVWHGLQNQYLDEKIFNNFDENWLISNFQKKLFINPHKLDLQKCYVTSYGRLNLINKLETTSESKIKNILIANTWSYKIRNESLDNFSINNRLFVNKLESIGKELSLNFLIRPHINFNVSSDIKKSIESFNHVYLLDKDVSAEECINMSDMLLTDWSSIIFDFLYANKKFYLFEKQRPFKNPPNPIFNLFESKRIKNYKDFDDIFRNLENCNYEKDFKDLKKICFDEEILDSGIKNYIQRLNLLTADC